MPGMNPNKPIVSDNENDLWLGKSRLTEIERIVETITGMKINITKITKFEARPGDNKNFIDTEEYDGYYDFIITVEDLTDEKNKTIFETTVHSVDSGHDGFMTVFLYELLKSLRVQNLERITEEFEGGQRDVGFRVSYVDASSGNIKTWTALFPYDRMIREEAELRQKADEAEESARREADRLLGERIDAETAERIKQDGILDSRKQNKLSGDPMQLVHGDATYTNGFATFLKEISPTGIYRYIPSLGQWCPGYMVVMSADKLAISMLAISSCQKKICYLVSDRPRTSDPFNPAAWEELASRGSVYSLAATLIDKTDYLNKRITELEDSLVGKWVDIPFTTSNLVYMTKITFQYHTLTKEVILDFRVNTSAEIAPNVDLIKTTDPRIKGPASGSVEDNVSDYVSIIYHSMEFASRSGGFASLRINGTLVKNATFSGQLTWTET